MTFSLINIYGSNVPSSRSHVKASMVLMIADFFMYTQLYKITSKKYFKTHFIKLINGPDEVRTRVLLLVCMTP